MTITQTVDIPADHRLTIDVPSEVPEGQAILTFTPAPKRKLTEAEEIEYISRNAEWLNKQAEDMLEFICDVNKAAIERRRQESGYSKAGTQ
jgi:hypothetical protein